MMFRNFLSRKRYGFRIPRSKQIELRRGKCMEHARMRCLKHVVTIDVFAVPLPPSVPTENRRVKEIVFADLVILIITDGGIGRVYDLFTAKHLTDLNPFNPWRKVTTAVYYQPNDTVVVVFEPTSGSLQCKVYTAKALQRSISESPPAARDFENLFLRHPAFFEFDEANGVILAAQQGETHSFQFWRHQNYTHIFSITDEFEEVRISHGLIAMLKPICPTIFSVSVFDIENGNLLREVSIPIDPFRPVEFVELLVSQLLFKQERASLRIINLLDNGSITKVPQTRDSFAPNGFVFFEPPSGCAGKKYFDKNPRRFFTISTDRIQFWMIQWHKLEMLHTVEVTGLRDASLCQQSVAANILIISASQALDLPHNEFVSGLSLRDAKTDLRGGSSLVPSDSDSPDAEDFNCPSTPSRQALRTEAFKGLQLFSLNDGTPLGCIPTTLCGKSVEVLQVDFEKFTVACGDHTGLIKLIMALPSAPECVTVEWGDTTQKLPTGRTKRYETRFNSWNILQIVSRKSCDPARSFEDDRHYTQPYQPMTRESIGSTHCHNTEACQAGELYKRIRVADGENMSKQNYHDASLN